MSSGRLVKINKKRTETFFLQIYATEVVNATDAELPAAVRALEKQISVGKTQLSRVVCGMDTRCSGPCLMNAARAGAALFNVQFDDIGVVSTPMLHYAVKAFNEPKFAEPTHDGYYSAIADSFKKLYEITEEPKDSRYGSEKNLPLKKYSSDINQKSLSIAQTESVLHGSEIFLSESHHHFWKLNFVMNRKN